MTQGRLQFALKFFWYSALLLALVFFFQKSYTQALNVDETAFACDSFGYLQMARENRAGSDYSLESSQTRLLVDLFKSDGVPVALWDEFVAPHAHHYQPIRDKVMPQYPPGTGRVLAMFPEGQAVHDLNLAVEWTLFVFAILAQMVCIVSGARVSSGLFAISFIMGFELLRGIGTSSFSVNASLVPMLWGVLLIFLSWISSRLGHSKLSAASAFVSGSLFGMSILIRIASVLMIPGLCLLLWEKKRGPLISFVFGVVLAGIAPLLWHQYQVTGAWFHSTYNAADASRPSLSAVVSNLGFYLGSGPGARYDWALFVAVVVSSWKLISKRRIWVASGVIILLPLAYFLTHSVTTFYYLALSIWTYLLVVSVSVWALEAKSISRPKAAVGVVVGILLISLIGVLEVAPKAKGPGWSTEIPSELKSSEAWIWSDLTSGSFWYYDAKPAFKAPFATSEIRAKAWALIQQRRQRLYLVLDSPDMNQIAAELEKSGMLLVPRGAVFDQPYLEVRSK